MRIMFSPKHPNLGSFCIDHEIVYPPNHVCPCFVDLFIHIWAIIYQFEITTQKPIIRSIDRDTRHEHTNPRLLKYSILKIKKNYSYAFCIQLFQLIRANKFYSTFRKLERSNRKSLYKKCIFMDVFFYLII